ncbi:MAG: histidinol phosphate phosphatase [Acidobacteria bacterium]|nr:MAG: histidinol phosphate phosphatase [Acidobacteriota bacterium]
MDHKRPRQVVILAGGRGTRLAPLTDTMPKTMIKFHGKPFLEYLVESVRDQGFDRILLLLGYLPHVIQNYFRDGSAFGVCIDYSVSAVENETGLRLKLAYDNLDSCFLLMYSDNYWPLRFDAMWDHFVRSEALAQLTVYTNEDNYSKSNVSVDAGGRVTLYDKSKSSKDLRGVEIGFAILKKEVCDLLPRDNVNFESVIYPRLVQEGQLVAFRTSHRYYSVGSHERLRLTEQFLRRRRAIILDRDGVLNEKPSKAEYVTSWSSFKWLAGVQEALRLLKLSGYTIIVITNQAGIARGFMTESELIQVHERMKSELSAHRAFIDAIYYCPHGWDEGCFCRKPQPGMLFMAQRDFHLDLTRTYFIGDDIRDVEAGEAAGCPTFLVDSEWPLLRLVKEKIVQVRPFSAQL